MSITRNYGGLTPLQGKGDDATTPRTGWTTQTVDYMGASYPVSVPNGYKLISRTELAILGEDTKKLSDRLSFKINQLEVENQQLKRLISEGEEKLLAAKDIIKDLKRDRQLYQLEIKQYKRIIIKPFKWLHSILLQRSFILDKLAEQKQINEDINIAEAQGKAIEEFHQLRRARERIQERIKLSQERRKKSHDDANIIPVSTIDEQPE